MLIRPYLVGALSLSAPPPLSVVAILLRPALSGAGAARWADMGRCVAGLEAPAATNVAGAATRRALTLALEGRAAGAAAAAAAAVVCAGPADEVAEPRGERQVPVSGPAADRRRAGGKLRRGEGRRSNGRGEAGS